MALSEVFNMDCMEGMKQYPDGYFDLLVTDPPYGITQNEWDKSLDFESLWREWLRVVKPNGAFVFTTAQPFTADLINSNRKIFKYDLIWHKPLCSGFLNARKMPLRNHENILVFYRELPTYNPIMGYGINKKGIRNNKRTGDNYGKFNDTDKPNYFDDGGKRYPNSVITISNGNRNTHDSIHPTQKPIPLFSYLIQTYSNIGDKILDCYVGSGSSRIAASDLDRSFIGFELDKDYFEASEKRYRQHIAQQKLFV
jgi:site-specific DNA-methyltransferase (adenine-specific)